MRDSVSTYRNEASRVGGAPSDAAVRSLAREVVERLSRAHSGQLAPDAAEADKVAVFCDALTGHDPDLAERLAREALSVGVTF
jgi:hypothetical protein